jgi:hypothetical protein
MTSDRSCGNDAECPRESVGEFLVGRRIYHIHLVPVNAHETGRSGSFKETCFPQRRKGAKKKRIWVFLASLRLCAFAGDSYSN